MIPSHVQTALAKCLQEMIQIKGYPENSHVLGICEPVTTLEVAGKPCEIQLLLTSDPDDFMLKEVA